MVFEKKGFLQYKTIYKISVSPSIFRKTKVIATITKYRYCEGEILLIKDACQSGSLSGDGFPHEATEQAHQTNY